ncbi:MULTISPECIES: hypothetical protein [Staphylococcus]|uniref:Uncharacterized protein n=1 Tax=Staphylococcus capitis TaxID=29388 RepID=A0ABX1SX32_STACP|nr:MULTISPECIES: hypothetical protein [Staphylococcus]MDS0194066.1 hypothetical protein [Staphylococcus capitis]MDS0233029.1 hypothetical protein [Staphylococcus capitis]NMK31482.1 hypothetical protein [Staphylococcus capitis]NMK55634.1 hypothetical protein [Staphylococcus capitis]NMK60004.1 hypothetical protein [Staphylococcus capitis]
MENETLIEHRLNTHDENAKNQSQKIDKLEEELKLLKEKENQRYIEITRLNARLDTDSKNTKDTVNRLIDSVDKLVEKIDNMTESYSEYNQSVERRFNKVEKEMFNFINNKRVNKEALKGIDTTDEEKTMSKTAFTTITLAIIAVVETFVRYVAPIIFQ